MQDKFLWTCFVFTDWFWKFFSMWKLHCFILIIYLTDSFFRGPSLSWLNGSWIYNYLCNQCLSPLKLWVRAPFDATLCDKVCQWLVTCRWFSLGTLVSSTNKTDRHDITEILLKVELNIINQPNQICYPFLTLCCHGYIVVYIP
jgi:hypothetical protein